MRKQKREWLLSSLLGAEAADVALVRPKVVRPRVATGLTLLLAGDVHARTLAPALSRLALAAGAKFVLAIRPRSILASTWLCRVLERSRPTVVVLTMEPMPLGCQVPRPLWMPPPGSLTQAGPDVLPTSSVSGWSPTAKGYAAWAVLAWRMIG